MRGGWNEGGGFEKDGRYVGKVFDVVWVLGGPLVVTVDEPGLELGEVIKGLLTVLG